MIDVTKRNCWHRPPADAAADTRAVARVIALTGKGIAWILHSLLHAIARMSGVLAIAALPLETWAGGWLLGLD